MHCVGIVLAWPACGLACRSPGELGRQRGRQEINIWAMGGRYSDPVARGSVTASESSDLCQVSVSFLSAGGELTPFSQQPVVSRAFRFLSTLNYARLLQ